jgi:hypothetical protein
LAGASHCISPSGFRMPSKIRASFNSVCNLVAT